MKQEPKSKTDNLALNLCKALNKISEQEKVIAKLEKKIMVLNQKSWLSEQCGDDLW